MIFKTKSLTYFLKMEPRGIMSIRFSLGYMDTKEDVWELTFDI